MPRLIAAAIGLLVAFAADPAAAEVSCAPYCDFFHYYGPYDFTYIRPGLYAYPRCGPNGDCSPFLVYSLKPYRGRVTVRSLARPPAPRY
jgi:hypothetical protein